VETIEFKGTRFVAKQHIGKFFSDYVSHLNITPKAYKIPENLLSSRCSWANTLVNMYNEKFAYPTCVSPDQGQLLKDIVSRVNPRIILEVGCFIGVSTIWMASSLEELNSDGFIHSVDLFETIMPSPPHCYGYLKNPFEFAQKSAVSAQLAYRIKFHKMNSNELGKKFTKIIGQPIDLLFIDGDHSIHGCLDDFVSFYPHVSVGGSILLHDIYPQYCGYHGPRYVIDHFIKDSPHFSYVEIDTSPVNFGMALIRKLGDDKNLFHTSDVRVEISRAKVKLAKTPFWSGVRDTYVGKWIKQIVNDTQRKMMMK
jgi:predicted O-methyltransferase YrrM